MPDESKQEIFIVSPPGIEALTAAELDALGYGKVRTEEGGCVFAGSLPEVMRANLWLRTASRVTMRIARFRVTAFHELERLAKQVEWSRYLAPGSEAEFRVTCKKSRLYHSDAVAERFGNALLARAAGVKIAEADADDEDIGSKGGRQRFIVRLYRDECTVSIDSSGELLHRRGYRQAIAKAPLRENLAAAMVMAVEWDVKTPFLDPMCGSGTLPIEAAMIARKIPPGLNRIFAFQEWPEFDRRAWDGELERAAGMKRDMPVRAMASDRDAGATSATLANAERAGVAENLEVTTRSLTEAISVASAQTPGIPGAMVTNPPYGHRVGEEGKVRDLYAQIGKSVRRWLPGWRIALLATDARSASHLALPRLELLSFRNGGIPVKMIAATVPEA